MIGDQADIFARLKRLLPRWFGQEQGPTPVLDALLQGASNSLAFCYSLYAYAKLQTRIATATDGWLDMISADFFGITLQRRANQSDTSFRALIIATILRPRATRAAVRQAIVDLTGREPIIVEPSRPMDTGAWDIVYGWDAAGAWGALDLPYQAFITVFRPPGSGVPYVDGWDAGAGGWDGGVIEWISDDMVNGIIQDADIYEAIDAAKPAGTIMWTQILN